MKYEIVSETRALKIRFDVSGVEYEAKPMIVTGLHIECSGAWLNVEVLGRRALKSGMPGTPCASLIYDLRKAPEWVNELIDVFWERYNRG